MWGCVLRARDSDFHSSGESCRRRGTYLTLSRKPKGDVGSARNYARGWGGFEYVKRQGERGAWCVCGGQRDAPRRRSSHQVRKLKGGHVKRFGS